MSQNKTNALSKPDLNTLYILDIDSTLVTTHQRNQAIVESFVEIHSSVYPEDCKIIGTLDCRLGDYGFRSTMQRKGVAETDLSCFKEFTKYWRQHFFSNAYLSFDQPTAGAVEWTQRLNSAHASFVYLTARHKVSMWDGTLKTMNEMGFPIHKDQLYLKEDLSLTDEEYKSALMQQLINENPEKQLLLIDNEPVVLNKIAQDHPEILLVWFELTHSGKMQPPVKALAIQNFIF